MNRLSNRQEYSRFFKIATPMALQGFVSSGLGLVDNLMVGALGEKALAAVGIGVQLYFIHYLLLYGFLSGCATFIAQFYGVKDHENIRKTTGFMISVATIMGIVFFALSQFASSGIVGLYTSNPSLGKLASTYMQYGGATVLFMGISIPLEIALKATQQTKKPLYISGIAFGCNTILNYILIFGHLGFSPMGVKGAAIATVASRAIEFILILTVISISGGCLRGKLASYFSWNRSLIKAIVDKAKITTASELLWSVGQTFYTGAYAHLGVSAYAAYQAAININGICHAIAISVGEASLILTGEALGEKQYNKAYNMGKDFLRLGILIGIALGIAVIIMAIPLTGLYNLTAYGLYLTKIIIYILAAFMVVNVVAGIYIIGLLRAGGDIRFAMAVDVGGEWFLGIPLSYISAMWLGLPIYLTVIAARSVGIVKIIILHRRFLTKKWIRNLIEGL